MGSIKFNLNPLKKGQRFQIYLQFFVGLAYIIFGLFKSTNYDSNFWEVFIWIIGGLIFLIISFFNKKVFPEYYVEFSDSSLKFKTSLKELKVIEWEKIKEIEIKATRILIFLNDGNTEKINLSNTNYQNVISIKKNISEFATNKNFKII